MSAQDADRRDWPTFGSTADVAEADTGEEIRDPATGDTDGYVLAFSDETVPPADRGPADGGPADRGLPDRGPADGGDAGPADGVTAGPPGDDAAPADGDPAAVATVPGTGDFPLWPAAEPVPVATAARPAPPARAPYRAPRRPGVGLPLLVVLGLAAAFLGWVGAEPLWLAAGHADRGTLTVTDCSGGGVTARCTGDFTTDRYRAPHVALTGDAGTVRPGARLAARMVGPHGRTAYTGGRLGLTLRWAVPLGLIVVLGLLIAFVTGAGRLHGRQRVGATLLCLAGPLLLSAGILATAW